MKLAYFSGCKIPFYMKDYDLSFKAIMEKLGVELEEPSFNCCGNPARNDNFEISMLSAIKNLAIAQQHDLDLITPCKCCFGQFKHAFYWYATDARLKDRIDALLAEEGLSWNGKTRVQHLLSFLVEDFGLDALKAKIEKKLSAEKIVIQYGCHALRPFSITGFDNPLAPKIFEQVMDLTGVQVQEWSKSTECCGNPVLELQPDLSLKILQGKFDSASKAGAQYICTACTHCQMQYEMTTFKEDIDTKNVQPLLFTQILGAALGINEERLSESGTLFSELF